MPAMQKKPKSPADPPSSLAYADAWVDVLRAKLPEAVKSWDAEAIHQSRVATRRLRAALGVVEPVLSKGHRKQLGQTLRKLRRRFGPVRDLDVMLADLDRIKPAGPGVEWLRKRLADERDDRREAVSAHVHPTKVLAKLGSWWAVRQEWEEAGDAVDGLLANSVHLQLDAFIERATGVTTGDRSANDPHELRIAGKALRYTLEMAVASGHPLPPAVAKTFKRMQDALGAWHDRVVLADRATRAALEAGLAYHDPALHLAVLDVARGGVQRSVRHMAAFADLWRKQGEELAETIRATFPISRSTATESQTGRDRPGSPGRPDPAPPAPADPPAA
jgi:CHAD domain-containing protein